MQQTDRTLAAGSGHGRRPPLPRHFRPAHPALRPVHARHDGQVCLRPAPSLFKAPLLIHLSAPRFKERCAAYRVSSVLAAWSVCAWEAQTSLPTAVSQCSRCMYSMYTAGPQSHSHPCPPQLSHFKTALCALTPPPHSLSLFKAPLSHQPGMSGHVFPMHTAETQSHPYLSLSQSALTPPRYVVSGAARPPRSTCSSSRSRASRAARPRSARPPAPVRRQAPLASQLLRLKS